MKAFFIQLVKVFGLIIIFLFLLDLVYTKIYNHPTHARSKVSWLKNIKKNQEFDFAIFGSSRGFYHLNPKQIETETGLYGINLAYPGSNNFEIKLMVKEFLNLQQVKKIFIQVDNQYNKEYIDNIAVIPWMPYIKEESIYKEIKAVDNKAFYKKNIPFYRYMIYDSKLGFRELIMNLIKPNKFEQNNGFANIYGDMQQSINKSLIFELEDKKNKQLEEIVAICKKEDIELYFFTAPYYKTSLNTNVLKKNLPNYADFSKSINQVEFFRDFSHLNSLGAKKFTEIFSSAYFKS